MDAIATQIQNLAKAADEAGRKKVLDALRDLQHTIETPYDVLQRFAGLVSELISINMTYGDLVAHL
jgi:hypothetical protein